MDLLQDKVYCNALLCEKLIRLDKGDRQKLVLELLKSRSERELSEELGIPHSTIHDWKSLRQSNKGENIHVSLSLILRKLKHFKVESKLDRVLLKEIKLIVDSLVEDIDNG